MNKNDLKYKAYVALGYHRETDKDWCLVIVAPNEDRARELMFTVIYKPYCFYQHDFGLEVELEGPSRIIKSEKIMYRKVTIRLKSKTED